MQSQELRQRVVQEWHTLQERAVWVERGYTLARSSLAIWPMAAGVLGLVLGRSKGSLLTKGAKVFSWWRLGKKLFRVWQSLKGNR